MIKNASSVALMQVPSSRAPSICLSRSRALPLWRWRARVLFVSHVNIDEADLIPASVPEEYDFGVS
jgi:hypothetical protein